MALLEGRGLSKHFGGVVALSEVSFTIEEGNRHGADRAERGR